MPPGLFWPKLPLTSTAGGIEWELVGGGDHNTSIRRFAGKILFTIYSTL